MNIQFAKPREKVAFDGERCTPWVETQILSAHMHRYLSTIGFCEGKRVLDIACGEGYGAAMLIRHGAKTVTGVDIDGDAVDRANRIYAHEGLEFAQGDIRQTLAFRDDSFDVIVCFETIEHIEEHAGFVAELARVLTADGVLVISTPDGDKSDPGAPNPFHAKELSEPEFLALIAGAFQHVTTFYQGYHFGSFMTGANTSDNPIQNWNRTSFMGYTDESNQNRYIIAVASNAQACGIPTGLLHDGSIIASLNKRIRALEAELADARSQKETSL